MLSSVTVSVVDTIGPPALPVVQMAMDQRRVLGGAGPHTFAVVFGGPVPIDEATVAAPGAFRVRGPNGYDEAARFVGSALRADAMREPRPVFLFEVPAPGGRWDAEDNGIYDVSLGVGGVRDVSGTRPWSDHVGSFAARVPMTGPDVVAALGSRVRGRVRPGAAAAARVTVSNLGPVAMLGTAVVTVGLVAADQTLSAGGPTVLGERLVRNVLVTPGKAKAFFLRFKAPRGLTPGAYRVVAWVTVLGGTPETDAWNNAATGPAVVVAAQRAGRR